MNYAFRLVPCSIYENEIMETWLEELALQGLVLENISCGIAKFRKGIPFPTTGGKRQFHRLFLLIPRRQSCSTRSRMREYWHR